MQDRTLSFFLGAFGITWTLQLPAWLAHHGVIEGPQERFLPLVGLGALGPLLAAILAARLESRGGVRALFRPLFRWRVPLVWYLVALFLPGGLLLVGMTIFSFFGGSGSGWYPPDEAARWVALLFFPLGEEVGWRGFALPRLQTRLGPLGASLLLGALWCAWHAMMFDLSGMSPTMMVGLLPFFMAGSVFFTWLWNRTEGSLLLAVLAHAGTHLNNSNRPLPAEVIPTVIHSIAFVFLALFLFLSDREALTRPAGMEGRLR